MKHKRNTKKISLSKLTFGALAASVSITGILSVSSPVFAADDDPVSYESAAGSRGDDPVQDSSDNDDIKEKTTSSDEDHSINGDMSGNNESASDDTEKKDPADNADSPTDDTGYENTVSEDPADIYQENQDKKYDLESSIDASGVQATKNTGEIKAESSKKLNGWQLVSGKYYYYKNNTKYTGWHYMSSGEGENKAHWSYFGNDGALRTGWVQFGKGTANPDGNSAVHWSYFGDNGWLRTGWAYLGKGTSNPDGNSTPHWSYFGTNGWLKTGWVQFGKGTANPDGNSTPHWSYFNDKGWLSTGWVSFGKGTANPDGNTTPHWSYFGTNGWLKTGWVQLGKGTANPDGNSARHWSYFGTNGWLRTYWQQLGQGTPNTDGKNPAHFSYFGSNGWMVTGAKTIGGKYYVFDGKGWLTQGSISLSDANKNIGSDSSSQALLSSSETQLIADGCYRISPVKNTGYSIDVWGESAANNAKIWSYANNTTSAQLFQIKHLGNNIYSIKTGSSIYASGWDISGGKAVAGAAVVQNRYTGSSTQKWKIVSAGDGSFTIKPAGSDLSVDIEGGKLSEGTVKLAKHTGSNTQRFKITKASGFLMRNGRKYYFNQNGDKPMIGIDVSAWSENVNWERVKADGIEFAIIRVSHRGGLIDRYGARNMRECTRLGIPFGVYCYSYAVTNAQADHEVDVLLSTLKGYNPALGVFIDVEDTTTYQNAFGNIYSAYARRKITDITKRMVNRVQNAGYLAGVYANEGYLNNVLYLNEMPNARWVARYYDNNASDTNIINMAGKGYKIWQFTDRGVVSGVPNSGSTDLNTLIEKYW